jgi:hypothetical protein
MLARVSMDRIVSGGSRAARIAFTYEIWYILPRETASVLAFRPRRTPDGRARAARRGVVVIVWSTYGHRTTRLKHGTRRVDDVWHRGSHVTIHRHGATEAPRIRSRINM